MPDRELNDCRIDVAQRTVSVRGRNRGSVACQTVYTPQLRIRQCLREKLLRLYNVILAVASVTWMYLEQ